MMWQEGKIMPKATYRPSENQLPPTLCDVSTLYAIPLKERAGSPRLYSFLAGIYIADG